MATKTYDFKRVCLILGPHIVSGFAEGTGITVEYSEDRWTPSTGSDGEFTRSKSNNNEGSFTITLQHSSQSNAILSGFALADKLTNSGTFPVLLKDLNGDTVAAADVAYVQTTPSVEFGAEAADREWTIYTGNLQLHVGGIT